jgi:hypothetical protein
MGLYNTIVEWPTHMVRPPPPILTLPSSPHKWCTDSLLRVIYVVLHCAGCGGGGEREIIVARKHSTRIARVVRVFPPIDWVTRRGHMTSDAHPTSTPHTTTLFSVPVDSSLAAIPVAGLQGAKGCRRSLPVSAAPMHFAGHFVCFTPPLCRLSSGPLLNTWFSLVVPLRSSLVHLRLLWMAGTLSPLSRWQGFSMATTFRCCRTYVIALSLEAGFARDDGGASGLLNARSTRAPPSSLSGGYLFQPVADDQSLYGMTSLTNTGHLHHRSWGCLCVHHLFATVANVPTAAVAMVEADGLPG